MAIDCIDAGEFTREMEAMTISTPKCTCPRPGQGANGSFGYRSRTFASWRNISTMGLISFIILLITMDYSDAQFSDPLRVAPREVEVFKYKDAEFYRYLKLENNTLYIGAMNYVIWLDATNISHNKLLFATKNLSNSTVFRDLYKACRATYSAKHDYHCQNHIKSIIPLDSNNVQICGTSAYNPKVMIFNKDNITANVDDIYVNSEDGRAICPLNPDHSSTVIYIKNQQTKPTTYSATMMDAQSTHPVIYRPKIPGSNLLRTEPGDTKWLNEPIFVKSFDVGDYVYFFMRESAIEYMNCGKAVYSRIARVCKSDKGGNRVLGSRFTTFFKVRLNCSIPGDFPFYFNELYDVYRIQDYFYGVFRTNHVGISGSAVCTFSNTDILKAFDGAFKEQTETTSIWMRVPDIRVPSPRPGNCSRDSSEIPDNELQFIKARPIMDESVAMHDSQPTFFRQDVEFSKIVVDRIKSSVDATIFTVFFLVSESGEIHKVVSWDGMNRTVAIWVDVTQSKPIQQIILDNGFLYISTDLDVRQMAVEQCDLYTHCTRCSLDPYCGWKEGRCQKYTSGATQNASAVDPIITCSKDCGNKTSENRTVNVPGSSVHFDCKSICEPTDNVQWYLNKTLIKIDETKYFQTAGFNSLIIFNVTAGDNGEYKCKSGDVVLRKYSLAVTGCNDPESCWKHEFNKWCKEFDDYQDELNKWKKERNQCTSTSTVGV